MTSVICLKIPQEQGRILLALQESCIWCYNCVKTRTCKQEKITVIFWRLEVFTITGLEHFIFYGRHAQLTKCQEILFTSLTKTVKHVEYKLVKETLSEIFWRVTQSKTVARSLSFVDLNSYWTSKLWEYRCDMWPLLPILNKTVRL